MPLNHLDADRLNTLQVVKKTADAFDIQLALIGASARDVFLTGMHGVPPIRNTMDADCAIRVRDWDHYRVFREELLQSANFSEDTDPNHPERLISPKGDLVDLLPFGGVEAEEQGSITWPADNVRMSVIGFNDVFETAEEIQFFRGKNRLSIRVVNLAGIALLKLIAWTERATDLAGRRKHVGDIYVVMENYARINSNRLEHGRDAELGTLYRDALLAGAHMLGRDIRRQCGEQASTTLNVLLKKQADGKGECVLNRDLRPYVRGSFRRAKELVKTLYTGFCEG